MHTPTNSIPPIKLLIGQTCPHCNNLIQVCLELLKSGKLAKLEIINIEKAPDPGLENIRSVPVMWVGDLRFDGMHTREEILYWLDNAEQPEGLQKYLDENLKHGNLPFVKDLLSRHQEYYQHLIKLLNNKETSLHTRIGISALFEEISGSGILRSLFSELASLTRHEDANVRGDACYFLSLTGMQEAREYLQTCLNDENPSVREIAKECLDDF